MPASFHIEALKAQALAAEPIPCSVCPSSVVQDAVITPKQIFTDSTHCQAYRNPATVKEGLDRLKQAVEDTSER